MYSDNSLEAALLAVINDPTEWDYEEGCSMGQAYELAEELGGDTFEAACRLIADGQAFVSVPLSLMSLDTILMPISWEVGESARADIIDHFGEPHFETSADGGSFVYDLYVEEVEPGYPAPPQPYSARDAAAEGRPEDCNFPFEAIWPPEALQIEFVFDNLGTLRRSTIRVRERVT